MATNPNNAVGTNGAFGGRTSVNAFNDVLSIFNSRGIVQGWDMAPNSGMIINLGGDGSTRDVAVAEDNIGNKTTINNISEEPIPVEIPAAPATGSRIDAVVAYVDNPAQGSATVTDNYGACGLIVVSGSAGSSPTTPTESDIRTAITADGGAGSVAYYVVIGTVTVASGTTDISANMLTKGAYAGVTSDNVDFTTFDQDITTGAIANNAVTAAKLASAIDPIISTTTVGSDFTLDTYRSGKKHLYGIKTIASSVAFSETYWSIYQRTSAERYTINLGTTINVRTMSLQRMEWGDVINFSTITAGSSINSVVVVPVQPLGASGATSVRIGVDIWGS